MYGFRLKHELKFKIFQENKPLIFTNAQNSNDHTLDQINPIYNRIHSSQIISYVDIIGFHVGSPAKGMLQAHLRAEFHPKF